MDSLLFMNDKARKMSEIKCKACGEDWERHTPIMSWCPNGKTKWEPNTPASDQPEYRTLGPDEVIQAGDEIFGDRSPSAWHTVNETKYTKVQNWPRFKFRRPIAAEKREEVFDPVCLIHGKKKSEHRCLYCCLCFKSLTLEECSFSPCGCRTDVCIPCAESEQKQIAVVISTLQQLAQEKQARKLLEDKLNVTSFT